MSNPPKNLTTQEDKSRIMSTQSTKYDGGSIPKDSFASRSQAAADKHTHQGLTGMPNNPPKNPITQEAKSRIMSTQSTKYDGGSIPKDSFASRSQSAADNNTNQGISKK